MYELRAISGNLQGGVVEITDPGGGTRHLALFPAETICDLAMVDDVRGVACGHNGHLALFDCRSLTVEARAKTVGMAHLAVLRKSGLIAVQGSRPVTILDARTLTVQARYIARQRADGQSWRLMMEQDSAWDARQTDVDRTGTGDIRTPAFSSRLVERADGTLVTSWVRSETVPGTAESCLFEKTVCIVFLDLAQGALTEVPISRYCEAFHHSKTYDTLWISPDGRHALRRSPALPGCRGELTAKPSLLGRIPGLGRRHGASQAGPDMQLAPALEIWRLDPQPVLERLVEPTLLKAADLRRRPAAERDAPQHYRTRNGLGTVTEADLRALMQPFLKPLVEHLHWSEDAFDRAFRRSLPGKLTDETARWTLANLLSIPVIFFDFCLLASARDGDLLERWRTDDATPEQRSALKSIRLAAAEFASENLAHAWTADSRSIWVLQGCGQLRRIDLDGRLGPVLAAEPIAGRERMSRWTSPWIPRLAHCPDGSLEVESFYERCRIPLPPPGTGTVPAVIRIPADRTTTCRNRGEQECRLADKLTRAIRGGMPAIRSWKPAAIIAGIEKLARCVEGRWDDLVVDGRWEPALLHRDEAMTETLFCRQLVKARATEAVPALEALLGAYLARHPDGTLDVWHTDDTTPTCGPVVRALILLTGRVDDLAQSWIARRDMDHDGYTPEMLAADVIPALGLGAPGVLRAATRVGLQMLATGNVTRFNACARNSEIMELLAPDAYADLIVQEIQAQSPRFSWASQGGVPEMVARVIAGTKENGRYEQVVIEGLLKRCPDAGTLLAATDTS
ncbi:MAG TPA: hypothetical protein VHG30_06720 [Microvirga sp.]|nr:hypothetical protein [Microvirga sp.]